MAWSCASSAVSISSAARSTCCSMAAWITDCMIVHKLVLKVQDGEWTQKQCGSEHFGVIAQHAGSALAVLAMPPTRRFQQQLSGPRINSVGLPNRTW